MGNVLQFSIGLEVAQFLDAADVSAGKILSLVGVGEMLHKAMEKVFQSFEQGAALEHLSRRTGETAGNLYRLQAGLEACGVSAESLPSMLFLMQKSLGGVSEMGESTADVFHKLGLNIAELKGMGPAEAFAKITERMGNLSQDSAAKASSMIFGRMGAASAVQVSRSPQEFREAFADAARQADIFERAGAAFAEIRRTIGSIKRELAGFWAGIAEGAAPAVQTILNWLKKIDLTSIGERIGTFIRALGESFASGEFANLIGLGFAAGFELANHYGQKFVTTFCAGLAAAVPEALAAAFEASAGIIETVGGHLYDRMNNKSILESRKTLGDLDSGADWTKGYSPERLAEIRARNQANIDARERDINDMHAGLQQSRSDRARNAAASIQGALHAGIGAASDTWTNFGAAPTQAADALRAAMDKFTTRWGALQGQRGAGGDDVSFAGGLTHRTEGNVFEKMGLNMGGGSPMNEVAKNTARTADAASRTADGVEQLLEKWRTGDVVEPGMHAVL